MSLSWTNVMEWAGSGVAIIFAITSIIEVLAVRPPASGANTTIYGVLMVAGLASAIIGWQLERRQSPAGSTGIDAAAETANT
jgi:hypothetical protein